MVSRLSSHRWLVVMVVLGLLISCCIGRPSSVTTSANSPAIAVEPVAPNPVAMAEDSASPSIPARQTSPSNNGDRLWYDAVEGAEKAAQLAQTALSADDWAAVAQAWGESIDLLQSIPVDDPRRLFSQRKAREYLQNLQVAQALAEQKSALRQFPTLGSNILDEQVNLYRSYVATMGAPDILIMGSSRALQGVDPQALQQALAERGYPGLQVYNFSVNGATAQVVSFVTRQLFAADMYPKLVIWAGGSRAVNSGRFDRTFAKVLDSPGYVSVRDGHQLTTTLSEEKVVDSPTAVPDTLPLSSINALGFLSVENQFAPDDYYRSFPRIRGRYDGDYRGFRLEGVQTLSFEAVTQFFKAQQIPLVFVNLPLSNDYLNAGRLGYERQFQGFLQGWANQGAITLIDLLEQWRDQSHLFADPSHINRVGARAIAQQLAASGRIPWASLIDAEATPS
jgi:hypothetical protein